MDKMTTKKPVEVSSGIALSQPAAWPNLLTNLDILAFSSAAPGRGAFPGGAVSLVGHCQPLGGAVVLQDYVGGQTLQIEQHVGCSPISSHTHTVYTYIYIMYMYI